MIRKSRPACRAVDMVVLLPGVEARLFAVLFFQVNWPFEVSGLLFASISSCI